MSNHQPRDCLLNRLFRRRSKKTSKLRVTALCAGNSSENGEFPAQMASNAENVSIWWRHHAIMTVRFICSFPDSKVHGANMGPTWVLSAPDVPHAGPVSLAIRIVHDHVIKWKHFPRYWPFVRGIQRSPVNSPHKGQWRGALMFSLICARINGWRNNHEASDLRRYRAHYDVTVMFCRKTQQLRTGHLQAWTPGYNR